MKQTLMGMDLIIKLSTHNTIILNIIKFLTTFFLDLGYLFECSSRKELHLFHPTIDGHKSKQGTSLALAQLDHLLQLVYQ